MELEAKIGIEFPNFEDWLDKLEPFSMMVAACDRKKWWKRVYDDTMAFVNERYGADAASYFSEVAMARIGVDG